MGKDGEKVMSKDDLKDEHVRLTARVKEIEGQWEEIKGIFQNLGKTYEESKGTFTTGRYGQLKEMIKGATNEEKLEKIRQIVNKQASGNAISLLDKAKELSAISETKQDTAQASGPSKGGKMSSFMKKIKNITGFTDEPIRDEDVMSESELQRDNSRKQRVIQHHVTQCTKALALLEKLRQDYEASKSRAPPKRYQELKDMIKTTVAVKI